MRLTMFAIALLSLTGGAYAEPTSVESPSAERAASSVPITKLIAAVAKRTGKKFIIDPRVRADVEIVGQDTSNMSFGDLLTVLHLYDFVAVEYGGYVNVIPDAFARQVPTPLVTGKETRPDSEVVTKVISVKSISAAQLVPILRPMVPQYGHLAALQAVNKLIYVDTFANVQRLQAVIEALDVGEPYKPAKCDSLPEASK